jgi:adenylosuccinate synthase
MLRTPNSELRTASTCVVGLQWGDEAKGKVVDLLTPKHDAVVRFNGGANAGHTVVVGDQVYKLSQLPSGIVEPGLQCVIGNGVVINPGPLLDEIDGLIARGLKVEGRLWISDRAHVVFPYHVEEERLREESAGEGAIGTTRRGIGPCYADKVGRLNSVRLGDLLDSERLRERLKTIVPIKNRVLAAIAPDADVFNPDQLADEYSAHADRLRPYVTDTFWTLQRMLREDKRLLFEAAQGTLLDIDHGSYPFVTSSNSSACGLPSGCGVPARKVDVYLGVMKAYTTRVGGGPFPTELTDEIGEHIRQEGREFGTVTGRPRRCGWLDLVAVKYTAALNGVDKVAVMCLDVLAKLDSINVCVAYDTPNGRTEEFPVTLERLADCRPVFRTVPGWKKDLRQCRSRADLPKEALAFLELIAEQLSTPVSLCSVGPARDATIFL